MRPAFLRVAYAPRFLIVLSPLVEMVIEMFLLSSGMNIERLWRFTWRRRLPVGLNCVARVRFEYPPPMRDRLPVISHTRAIVVAWYHYNI